MHAHLAKTSAREPPGRNSVTIMYGCRLVQAPKKRTACGWCTCAVLTCSLDMVNLRQGCRVLWPQADQSARKAGRNMLLLWPSDVTKTV